MCNCGNKRKEFSQRSHAGNITALKKTAEQVSPVYSSFEYIGKTALTVTGNITRTQYRFNYPGARQNIDYRDVTSITAIPVLKKVT